MGDFGSQFSSADDIFSTFSDIFSEFFGFSQGRRGPRPQAGADLRFNLTMEFRDAARGKEINLNIPRNASCPECEGSGAKPGTAPEVCRQCGGAGQVQQQQGFFRVAITCPVCKGQGRVIENPCAKCRGRGLVRENKELQVNVPAGVDSGARLRLRGEGEPGVHGGPPGDLYVVIRVEEDETFQRQGQDLVWSTEISMTQAALGDKIEVPTLDEPVNMDIPKGTQSGEVFQMQGLGLPRPGSSQRGDLLVQVKVAIPGNLTKRQTELLKEFDEIEQGKPMRKVKNFFSKSAKKATGS
jgi:molecular chaperone DnaJ